MDKGDEKRDLFAVAEVEWCLIVSSVRLIVVRVALIAKGMRSVVT
jgi:hypothetical protein